MELRIFVLLGTGLNMCLLIHCSFSRLLRRESRILLCKLRSIERLTAPPPLHVGDIIWPVLLANKMADRWGSQQDTIWSATNIPCHIKFNKRDEELCQLLVIRFFGYWMMDFFANLPIRNLVPILLLDILEN